MGFLFDSLKNLVGDVECAMLTLDCDIQEKACDRYTGAKKSVYIPVPAAKVEGDNTTETTEPIDDTIGETVFNTCCKILKDMNISANSSGVLANTIAWLIKSHIDCTKMSANDVLAYNKAVPQQAEDIVSALTDLASLDLDKLLTELVNQMKANPAVVKRMDELEAAESGSGDSDKELTKPMTFGQFVQNNKGTMPQLV